jgi:UDP-N-acetyl-D-mannosaminuronate dehydrogenase
MESISSVNGDLSIFLQGRIVNQLLLERIVKFLGKNFTKSNICISGLAFKGMPLTNDLRDSPGVKIVEEFIKNYNPNEVLLHDYEISTFNILGRNYVSSSIYSEELEVLVICNNNYKYELDLIEEKFSKKLRIIDLCEAISRTVKKSSTYSISTWGDFS